MTDYVLDVSKWRCGDYGVHRVGEGKTLLLNEVGFMCCLGQFAEQAGAKNIGGLFCPSDVGYNYDPSFIKEIEDCGNKVLVETELARILIGINDNSYTTPFEKIAQIKEKLESNDHTLTVINDDILKGTANA